MVSKNKKLKVPYYQLLIFGTIQFLDLSKTNKNDKKNSNKQGLRERQTGENEWICLVHGKRAGQLGHFTWMEI